MNKKELPIFVALIVLVVAWPLIDRVLIAPMFPKKAPPPASVVETNVVPRASAGVAATNAPAPAVFTRAASTGTVSPVAELGEPASTDPARTVALTNAAMRLTFSSRGASLVEAEILGYRQTSDRRSPPVRLDFSAAPSLAWRGISGLGVDHDFTVVPGADGTTLRFERRNAAGVKLVRTVAWADDYLLKVRDEVTNEGGVPAEIPPATIGMGPMRMMPGESPVGGVFFLGIDTLAPGGEKVNYWSKKIPDLFKDAAPSGVRPPVRLEPVLMTRPVEWAAVKNKYFVQILQPVSGAAQGVEAELERAVSPKELGDPAYTKVAVQTASVAARMSFSSSTLAPGGEPLVREFEYYIGPKKYSELKALSHRRPDIMEFGFFGGMSKILLATLNFIYAGVRNYGIAIILLTVLVRIVFWPITHKSTESMKRMAEIQPLIQEMRQKYKDPQRQQKEMMALYKQHKINPLGGCLPILVQIPVFFALFVMLRSAIELRFAPFLWVCDLSEPENLFAGQIPLIGALNILPLLMTVTQVWQQKLTPSAGDPAQQKMMLWMPVIMLVFFYKFAAGLVLYWTTNQVLMIVQMLVQKYRREHRAAKTA